MTLQIAELAEVPMRFMWDVAIPMDDGVELRANVFLPVEGGSYPIIMGMTDYSKDLPFVQGYADAWKAVVAAAPEVAEGSSNKYVAFEAPDPEKWVVHGYGVVVMDSRGIGRSPGLLDPFSVRERKDFSQAIDWVGEQEWCDGSVGTLGMSYLGTVQWLAASEQPKHLKGLIPWEAPNDHLRAIGYHGGIPSSFWRFWTESQVRSVQHGLGTRGPRNEFTGELVCGDVDMSDEELDANAADIYRQVLQHPLEDEFWEGRIPDWDKITAPLLSVTTWGSIGSHIRGNIEGFQRSASAEKWLVTRGSKGTFAALYSDEGLDLQRRFFDHALKGEGDFAATQPKVDLVIRDAEDEVVARRDESEWPLARTEWTKLYFDPAATTLEPSAPVEEASVAYQADGKGVTLLAAPFEAETEITGPVAAKVWTSSNTTDADIFVALRVFDEQGKEKLFHGLPDPQVPLSSGWLRASQRQLDPERSTPSQPYLTHKTTQPLFPGEVYELDIEIWPTCVVIPAGYRIGLTILGKDFEHDAEPFFWSHPPGILFRGSSMWLHEDRRFRPADIYENEVTIYGGGEHPSHLLLPVIPT